MVGRHFVPKQRTPCMDHAELDDVRGDFSAERFRSDCVRLREELVGSKRDVRRLKNAFVQLLVGDMNDQLNWILEWHGQLAGAIGVNSRSEPGAPAFCTSGGASFSAPPREWKERVGRCGEETAEVKRLLSMHADTERVLGSTSTCREEFSTTESALASTAAQRRAAMKERARLEEQLQRLDEEEELDRREGTAVEQAFLPSGFGAGVGPKHMYTIVESSAASLSPPMYQAGQWIWVSAASLVEFILGWI